MPSYAYHIPSNLDIRQFIESFLSSINKKHRPVFFIDEEHLKKLERTKLVESIKMQLKGIPDFVKSLECREISIDDFANSLGSKFRSLFIILSSYLRYYNLPDNLLDEPRKLINSILEKCDLHLTNTHINHGDEFYLRFDETLKPLISMKDTLIEALYKKGIKTSEQEDLALYYAQSLHDLVKDNLKWFMVPDVRQQCFSK